MLSSCDGRYDVRLLALGRAEMEAGAGVPLGYTLEVAPDDALEGRERCPGCG